MFYIIYKTTNSINGNYYIGSHITNDLDDGYLGSGNLIVEAVKKYGKKSFKKEYLFFALDEKSLDAMEELLVVTNKEDPKSYNLIPGGNRPPIHIGEFHHLRKNPELIKRGKDSPYYGTKHPEERKEANRQGQIKRFKTQKHPMGGTIRKDTRLRNFLNNPTNDPTVIEKMVIAAKNRKKINCPHCNKLVDLSNAKRWHFDRCKMNK